MREFDLLHHIYQHNQALPARVTIPPGDDMGAVRFLPTPGSGEQVMVTVDQLADGVHFDLASTPLEKIARKAITRNLSDVAAMAALPVAAVAAACLPNDFGADRATALFDLMRQTAADFRCPLIGGDISVWPANDPGRLIITVTILAEPAGVEPVLRRGAQVGDVICVTGELGGSLETVAGKTHHLDFEPRLTLARTLAGSPGCRPHCMIDISDGLARDLRHLCDASGGVSAEVWADALPIAQAAHAASHRDGRAAWQHALADGEDYELCFTVAPGVARQSLPRSVEGVPITQIGVITPADGRARVIVKRPDGQLEPLGDEGWEHRGL